jgi:hypothetical protein
MAYRIALNALRACYRRNGGLTETERKGSKVSNGNLSIIGQRAWSYDTAIKDVLPDGRTIGNVTKYSATTSKHQTIAGVKACDVTVNDVPRGTDNLAQWYQNKHA